MANLGYWQMKVSPGVWYLQLAPGRSSELYLMKEDGEGDQETTLLKRLIINDMRGKLVHMEVIKKKGMEREKLLIPSDDSNFSRKKVRGLPLYFIIFFVDYSAKFIYGLSSYVLFQYLPGKSEQLEFKYP